MKDPDLSHELYNAGHLFEAAAAHYQATGKRNLLDIAIKEANLLVRHLRPGQAANHLARPPDRRDGSGQALPRHRRPAIPRPGQILPRRPRPAGGDDYQPVAHQAASIRPKPWATPSAPHICTSGMADVAAMTGDQRYLQRHRRYLGKRGRQKTLHHRRHRRTARRRGLRRQLRTAEPDRLLRNLRGHGQRLLESPPVPAARRRQIYRRDGTHAVQRPAFRRVARRQGFLLSQSARNPTAGTSAARGSAAPAAPAT